MDTLHVITACSRFSMLRGLATNFAAKLLYEQPGYNIRWHIAFQSPVQPDPHGCVKFNEVIDLVPHTDWIWILDDDNTVCSFFFSALHILFRQYKDTHKKAFVFSQNRADQLGPVLQAGPENMRPGGVDTAQVVFRKDLIGHLRFPENSKIADGEFYQKLFQIHGEDPFVFLPTEKLVNFNGCR